MIGGAKGIGLGIDLGLVNQYNRTGSQSYIEPKVLDSLVGVWSAYGVTNDSPDRSTIKNKLSNKGGDFVISNAAFKLNSGFGKYEVDFTSWIQTDGVIASSDKVQNSITGRFLYFNTVNKKEDVPSFKVNITLGQQSKLQYNYIKEDGTSTYIVYSESGIYTIPSSYFSKYTGGNAWFGFYQIEGTSTIEQIPSFEGAFVTDGIDDLITSTKTAEEMGITDEVTVVSMIHQINANKNFTITNNLRNENRVIGRNTVTNIGKTGIYGWYKKDIQGTTATLIDNILGDKNDYTGHYTESTNSVANSKFYVTGYAVENGFTELSSVAWYWTIIANKVLTTDQINQVIAYFNLDRTLNPDILCNVKKQGITNDNHADFNDKLIDYSGNGRDIQMYNLAWKGSSGVAAKKFETIKDYLIVPDEGLQELTIYNEFNYKVKSIKYADRYWAIQTLNKTDVSYPITIVSDKNIIWRNAINYTDENGVKRSIRKETNVPANTPTQVFVLGFNDFDVPDNYTKVNCVAYATRTDITEFTITFIPSCKGGILLDGIEDFGKVTGMSIYKDYTFIIDRKFLNETFANQVCLASKSKVASEIENGGAFIVDNISVNSIINPYSFYKTTSLPGLNTFDRQIVFQSKYKYLDKDIAAGTATDSDTLWLGTFRDNDERFANVAIYSLMSFPYSMSEFLIERQLKKHKLGTLYPDMVEFRPVITINGESGDISYANDKWENINIGDYINIGEIVHILLYRKDIEEISNVKVNGAKFQSIDFDSIYNHWNINIELTSKSPQKINITIDEYIRYEDIVHPYPVLLRFNDENGNEVSWGGKFRIGSTITRIGSIADPESNLLNGLYSVSGLSLNGKAVTSITSIVEKQMVFKTTATYLLDNNEPKCILSPSRLRIPNSSYKLLGYIPDISGHGNHGVIHNSAYAEGSGVNEDGSYQFDGVNDFVTIPTVTGGGKQVLMKVNNNTINSILYDQRSSGASPNSLNSDFAICTTNTDNNNLIAYQSRLVGKTYIDGILNTNITCEDLLGVLHNITITCDIVAPNNGVVPNIGRGGVLKDLYSKVALYDFMLFDEISTEDKIKELNEYIGIEAKVELPPYYYDAYGKTNLDEDKAIIQQRGIAVGDYDITNYNHAYDKMSGYGGYAFAKFDNTSEWNLIRNSTGIEVVSRNGYSCTLKRVGSNVWDFGNSSNRKIGKDLNVNIKCDKNIKIKWQLKYKTTENPDTEITVELVNDSIGPNPKSITLPHKTDEELTTLGAIESSVYYLVYFDSSTLPIGEEYTVEMLPLYPNGLVYDGVTDYSENTNIPAFTDYTYIIKRENLNNNVNSATMYKGNKAGGGAFIVDYIASNGSQQYSYGNPTLLPLNENTIIYGTKTSYNGSALTVGSNADENGLDIGHWSSNYKSIVLYKLILYPKTIPLLQINFLKNLMERDEIIDLDNKIFIQE